MGALLHLCGGVSVCVIFLGFCVFVSVLGRMVDALASRADEGRGRLRYASGSCQPSVDPRISEWGNPAPVMGCYRMLNEIGVRGERGEVKHLSTRRKRKQV